MLKFLTKQFLYGRLYFWLKERIGRILFLFIAIFLVIYFHNEYLNYIEYKNKFDGGYIGLSFIIKNTLILLIAFGYFYFYLFLDKAKKLINKNEEKTKKEKNNEMVDNLDQFLEYDEIDRNSQFKGFANVDDRSIMNATFNLVNDSNKELLEKMVSELNI